MLVLCTYANRGTLCAQIHSISSSRHHSYTNGGAMVSLPSYEFGSTSVYGNSVSRRSCYSTAPMHVANGTIKTMASTIKGGVLLDDLEDSSSLQRIRGRQNTMAPPTDTEDLPLGEGWDVVGLLALLCAAYALYCYRREQSKNTMRG